ncbi:MAG TPA: alcohol dehydrogenase catalytic domain-containing protein [Acidimicrobiales bacterium]
MSAPEHGPGTGAPGPLTGRALVVRDVATGARVEEVEVAPPQAGEVRVRLVASGICGSDLHVLHGRSNAATFPLVLGHEGAGVVEDVGPGVTAVAPGDHVVVALYGPCGACPSCSRGRFVHCTDQGRLAAIGGRMADGSTRLRATADGAALHPMVGAGTLAELAVLRASQVVRIDDDLPLDLLCLAGCGVTTGLGAVFNVADVRPGASVAVVGCGGVGLNVVQAARVAGATAIVAVDTNPARLELAGLLGATDRATTVAGIAEAVPGGVDVAFEVVGSPELVAEAFAATRPGGTCVVVGSLPPGATVPIDGRALFADRTLRGCIGGSNVPAVDIPRVADLYRRGRLDLEALVTVRRPFAEVATALDEAAAGAAARSVVLLSSP